MKWQVLAVDNRGRTIDDCGHSHATKMRAVRCPWTPRYWPDRCDLRVIDTSKPRKP